MTTHLVEIADLHSLVGTKLGTSDWFEITQDRVNGFADLTEDRQWIHVDPPRAAAEGPFGGPIAHGYLTLSLFSAMWVQILTVQNSAIGINYGLNKVRFPAPVPVGARVRMHAHLTAVETVPGGVQITLAATIECDRTVKPVCVAEPVYRLVGESG